MALVLVVAGLAGVGVAAEEPSLAATATDPVLAAGSTETVTLAIENDAADPDDAVGTARDVRVVVRGGDAPVDVRSGPRFPGALGDGERATVTVAVTVPADAPAGTYALPVAVAYTADGDRRTTTLTATVTIERRPRFRVVERRSTVTVGGHGTVTVSLANVGSVPATGATLTLRSRSGVLRVDGGRSGTRVAGTLAPGETVALTFDVTATAAANASRYALLAIPRYVAETGRRIAGPARAVAVTPEPESRLAIEGVEVAMLSARSGRLHLAVRNRGRRPLGDLRVVLRSPAHTIAIAEPTTAVGTLAPGETATVTARLSVAPDTAAEAKPFVATARFDRGATRATETHRFAARVNTSHRAVRITPVAATLSPDATGPVRLRIANVAGRPLRDVRVRLRPAPPVTSASPRAYVHRLEPGESTIVTLGATVDEDAVPATVPLAVTVTAETPAGWTLEIPPRRIPLTVARTGGGLLGPTRIAALVLVAVAGLVGAWWWRVRE